MTYYVLDASVIVKWVFPDTNTDSHVAEALAVLAGLRAGTLGVLQPPHWLAEVAAVVTRLAPELALEAVGLLYAMELPIIDTPDVYTRACELSIRLNHHVFDTLYHAVALSRLGGVLLTADERYYHKAHSLDESIMRLADFGQV